MSHEIKHLQYIYIYIYKVNILASCPWIRNPSYIGMKCLLNFWTVEIQIRIPFSAWIICSRHPWLSLEAKHKEEEKKTRKKKSMKQSTRSDQNLNNYRCYTLRLKHAVKSSNTYFAPGNLAIAKCQSRKYDSPKLLIVTMYFSR